jgi:hypothetical protein
MKESLNVTRPGLPMCVSGVKKNDALRGKFFAASSPRFALDVV